MAQGHRCRDARKWSLLEGREEDGLESGTPAQRCQKRILLFGQEALGNKYVLVSSLVCLFVM